MEDLNPQTQKKRALGRGLDALLGATRPPAVAADQAGPQGVPLIGERITRLPLEQIQRGRYQPRRDFDPDLLRELADSIAVQGVIQPIVVRQVEPDRYEIIAGERRWRASQQAGIPDIPVVIREVDEPTAVAIGLIENIQRADLNPLEEAGALERLLTEFQLTHQQIAEAVGKSRSAVTNLLRLLELNGDVKTYVDHSQLEMGHARALLGLKGPAQSSAAKQVVAGGFSVRETERLVRRLQQADESPPEPTPKQEPDPNVRRLQDDLADRLGARVQIQQGVRGTGKLVIAYNSLEELDGILAHIQ
ncbi:MAG TPA: ParB/RepB/Spo0J family partition protein [Lamprocystis sp. (in: g-proteobacteria)]|nr:ParB/RepB/Spo0J family partition protein [Lamprocystis sp. (in: g-proteobacteria)]